MVERTRAMDTQAEQVTMPHVRNAVALVLRENWPAHHENNAQVRAATQTHVSIAIGAAKWFAKHDPNFNPVEWLDKCTPYPELYPLSELWEVDESVKPYV